MDNSKILPESFYDRSVTLLAKDLLGKSLVRLIGDQRVTGLICETEAYDGMQDLACHARVGKTKRNEVMFGPAGHAYVYFTYGMHWCLNVVTGVVDYPAAVLIRAIEPQEGIEIIANNRENVLRKNWTNGPAKLTKALQIDRSQNGINLTNQNNNLWIEEGLTLADNFIKIGPRIGIDNTPEPWCSMPWRYRFDFSEIPGFGDR